MRFTWLLIAVALLGGCEDKKWTSAKEMNPDMSVETPIDQTIHTEELNVAIYPGAKAPEGLSPMMRSHVDMTGFTNNFVECFLVSPDSPDKIADFYQKNVSKPKVVRTTEHDDSVITIDGLNKKGEPARVRIKRRATEKSTRLSIRVKTTAKG